MTYEDERFKERHEVRLPFLERLVGLGWDREQIQCPSPGSEDAEWQVPANPSEAAKRERGASFDGSGVDIAVFDSLDTSRKDELSGILAVASRAFPDPAFSHMERCRFSSRNLLRQEA